MADRQLIDFRIKPPQRDSDDDPRVEPAPGMRRYDELYGLEELLQTPFEALVAEMEKFNVRGIMQAEYEASGQSRWWNDRVAELVGRRPDLFIGGIATVEPGRPDAIEELDRAHEELGLRGVVFQPGFLRIYPTDPSCREIFSYCQKRGVPVTLHTGVNFTLDGSIDFGRPIWVDQVACEFPDLVLVCNHGGWPWVGESIAVAWKHPNVYLEFGAIAPKYMAHPKGGWQPMPHWMRTQLRDQILLGTDWPLLHYDRLIEELPLLELDQRAERAYLGGNAERVIEGVWG